MTPYHQPTKSELWKQRLVDFERSDLTVAQFCQSIGCATATFYQWKRKLERPSAQGAFLQVQSSEHQATILELRLPSGIAILIPIQAIDSLTQILEHVA